MKKGRDIGHKVSRDINADSAHEYSAGNWMCRGIVVQNKRGSEMTNVTQHDKPKDFPVLFLFGFFFGFHKMAIKRNNNKFGTTPKLIARSKC